MGNDPHAEVGMTCVTGKQRYATPQEAHAALRIIERKRRKPRAWNHGKNGVHPCRACHGWHITSSLRRELA